LLNPQSSRQATQTKTVTQKVLVDVTFTTKGTLRSGIQTVTRELLRRWAKHPEMMIVAWSDDFDHLRTLTPRELHRTLAVIDDPELDDDKTKCDILTIEDCDYFLPELGTEPQRVQRIRELASETDNRVGMIGYDMIPFTSSETTVPDMPQRFADYISAFQDADYMIPISESAAVEVQGWRMMLNALNKAGPAIEVARLPVESAEILENDLDRFKRRLHRPDLPLVLVVGSFEPRKNHLRVLTAAKYLWREGLAFQLAFVGGNSWNSEEFSAEAASLQKRNFPIQMLRNLTDVELWAAYRLARFSIFPSLNEGYGLPVAESLAAGTPVITSGYGSMLEIAENGGGCFLVDPRDDGSITNAMRSLLVDDTELAVLADQAKARSDKTWDEYASEVWDIIMHYRAKPSIAAR